MAIKGFAREALPYLISKQEDGRWIAQNRDYRTITLDSNLDTKAFKLRGMTTEKLNRLSWNGDSSTDTIYLYNDGSHPMINAELRQAYLERLGLLIAASVEE